MKTQTGIYAIGLLFLGFGAGWCGFSKRSCESLCDVCGAEQLHPCFFLFLFVGIIFIISGSSLIMDYVLREDSKLKKKKGSKRKKRQFLF